MSHMFSTSPETMFGRLNPYFGLTALLFLPGGFINYAFTCCGLELPLPVGFAMSGEEYEQLLRMGHVGLDSLATSKAQSSMIGWVFSCTCSNNAGSSGAKEPTRNRP